MATQKVGRRLIERGTGGNVLFIGSLMSLLGLPFLTVYATTKSALAGLTRSLAAECGRHDIQVNCIASGFILTDLNRQMWQSADLRNWLAASQAAFGHAGGQRPHGCIFVRTRRGLYHRPSHAIDRGYTTTAVWPFQP